MTTFISSSINWGAMNVAPSNVLFRERILSIHNAIVGCGLVQTADTGQIDFATVNLPATGQPAGYAIYRFNDSRQGVDPVFMKVIYGNGTSNGITTIQVQIGQGSNGAGTLTGQLSTNSQTAPTQTGNTESSVQNYACHVDGYFGLFVGVGNISYGRPFMHVQVTRSRDAGYAFDGVGIEVVTSTLPTSAATNQFVRRSDAQFTGAITSHMCLIPGAPASTSLLNGDKQLYPHFYADPAVRQSWSRFTVRTDEFGVSPTTFTATPVSTGGARTFLSLGNGRAPIGEANASTTWQIASLWE